MSFDGPMVVNHRITVRTAQKTYEHLQRAIDRAYLAEKYGEVWKHARLSAEDYGNADFLAEYPEEGSIILEAFQRLNPLGQKIVDRIVDAIRDPYEKSRDLGVDAVEDFAEQIQTQRRRAQAKNAEIPSFAQVQISPPEQWRENYNKRSITKEIDQLVSQITAGDRSENEVNLTLDNGKITRRFEFDAEVTPRFHKFCAMRTLGDLFVMRAKITLLDRGNRQRRPKAKIINLDTMKEVNLSLNSEVHFYELHRLHTDEEIRIYVAPLVEAGGFDFLGGDLVYISLAP